MRMGVNIRGRFAGLFLSGMVLVCLLLPWSSQAQPEIRALEAYWADGLAIVHPEIHNPMSKEGRETLMAGNPVGYRVQMEVRGKDGTVDVEQDFRIEYNIWEGRFRVYTPQGAVVMTSGEALTRFFRDDFTLLLGADDIPRQGPWKINCRIGENLHPRREGENTIERELNWLAAWLYRRGRTNVLYSDWSETTTLERLEAP